MILFVTVEGVVEEDDEVEAEVEEGADAMESKLGYHERKAKEQSYKRKFSRSERKLYISEKTNCIITFLREVCLYKNKEREREKDA